jgi:ATP synthase protein I
MPEFKAMYARGRRYIFLLLAVYVLGWGYTDHKAVFLGLIFGTSLSLFNYWLMVRYYGKFENAILQGRKVRSLGTFSRLASGAVAVIVCMEYPNDLNLISTVLGLMTSYIVIMIDFFKQSFQLRK